MSWMELIIGLALAALLSMMAMPGIQDLYQKNQMQVCLETIQQALQFARVQATLRGERLMLTPITPDYNWSNGMMLLSDHDATQGNGTATILYQWQWPSPIRVQWFGFQSNKYLLFAPDLDNNATNGYFLIQSAGIKPLQLNINRLGRARLFSHNPKFGS